MIYGVDFFHHILVIAIESRDFVTAERIFNGVDKAFVAIGAWSRRQIITCPETLDQVVIGDKRTRHGNGIAVAVGDRFANIGRLLKTARTYNRNVDLLPDLAGITETDSLVGMESLLHIPRGEFSCMPKQLQIVPWV